MGSKLYPYHRNCFALLNTCKQIYLESSNLAYACNTFAFDLPQQHGIGFEPSRLGTDFWYFATQIGRPNWAAIRAIRVELGTPFPGRHSPLLPSHQIEETVALVHAVAPRAEIQTRFLADKHVPWMEFILDATDLESFAASHRHAIMQAKR